MSTPTDPAGQDPQPEVPEASAAPGTPAADATAAYPAADAQPTEVYPPGDSQPTEAYPPADAQPTEAYAPPAYDAPPVAPPPYGTQPGYGAQPYSAPAAAVDTRAKGLAWAALGSAIAGFVLVLVGFFPLPWVGMVSVVIGGLLLLVAFVLAIVALVKKNVGGTGLSVTALVLSVIGGIVGIFALLAALAYGLLASNGELLDDALRNIESAEPDDSWVDESEGTDDSWLDEETDVDEAEGEALSAGEAAFVAEVRPQLNDLFAEIDPSVTPDIVDSVYNDEMLITVGQMMLLAGDEANESFVEEFVSGSGGVATDDQARRFLEIIVGAAETHLQ